ncbi:hypothetical protein FO519_009867, partial [Halicephalobus sp. NKZ332]
MTRWYSIVVLYAVLQMSFSSKSERHFVGERNSKNYTIIAYPEDLAKLILTVKIPNGITQTFSLSTCNERFTILHNYIVNSQGSHLFYSFTGDNGSYLVVVNLTTLSNNISNGKCIFIKKAYFGKHKIYTYKIENNNILKRWLVNPEGKEVNPVVITKTESPIRHFLIDLDNILIGTEGKNVGDPYVYARYKDLPRCDIP